MKSPRKHPFRLLLLIALLGAGQVAAEPALRVSGKPAVSSSKSSSAPIAFRGKRAPSSALRLPILDNAARAQLEGAGDKPEKRSLIGVARTVSQSPDLQWESAAGGRAARFAVASPDARSLRLGLRVRALPAGAQLRFAGDGAVLGPVSAQEALELSRLTGLYWSPVTEGDTQSVEIWIPADADPARVRLQVENASHLAVSASSGFRSRAKGAAASCHEDVACLSAQNPAPAQAARSVAKLVYTENGATYSCTGTLINDGAQSSQVPYLYTAAHCIDSQAGAASLNTFWFFEAAVCAAKSSGAYKQLSGGATLLHADAVSDAALLRLADRAPDGAWFSGWDATPLAAGTPVIGIHHPQGDLKKVAMGSALGPTAGSGGATYATASWLAGTTESGSSGSGLFTRSGNEYLLRGGLKGGSASCASSGRTDEPSNRDYYSRLEHEATALRTWLSAAPAPMEDYTDLWWNPLEPGWGISVTQHATNKVFVTWYHYDRDGRPTWMVVPDAAWRGTFEIEGTLYRTTGTSSEQSYDAARFAATPAGSLRVEFGSNDDATVTITVDGRTQRKSIRRQEF